MSRRTIIIGIISIVALACLVSVFSSGFKRSFPGRIIRRLQGEAGAYQTVNDLADDIRREPALAELQPWSIRTLARFRKGEIQTNGRALYWPSGAVRLARQERPAFVTQQWGLTNRWGHEWPEISVVLSTNGQPECEVIGWYLHGIVVGAPDYRLSMEPWCHAEAKPGVYAYYLYK
jgi:hypothetical protein